MRTEFEDFSHHHLASAGELSDTPWHGAHWEDPVCLPTRNSKEPDDVGPKQTVMGEPDEDVSSYDDLSVSVGPAGRLMLECPTCGSISLPLRETTLSDLTNAAIDHLSEQHAYTRTLAAPRGAAPGPEVPARADGAASGCSNDRFWFLIGLLSEDAAGSEALARAPASSSPQAITNFEKQLGETAALLDVP